MHGLHRCDSLSYVSLLPVFAHVPECGFMAGADGSSRWVQKNTPESVSCVVTDFTRFRWRAEGWKTPPLEKLVLYECHVGSFSGYHDPQVLQSGCAPFAPFHPFLFLQINAQRRISNHRDHLCRTQAFDRSTSDRGDPYAIFGDSFVSSRSRKPASAGHFVEWRRSSSISPIAASPPCSSCLF